MDGNKSGASLPTTFVDYPKEQHRDDYEPARTYLKESSAELTGLLGLYEYGSVGAPGISDIDLIAVISDKIDPHRARHFLTGMGAPPHVIRVFDHGTIKPVSRRLFETIQIMGEIITHPIHEIEPIIPATLANSTRRNIDVANVFDWLPERILMLQSLLGQPTLSCRRVLGGLGSFRHSVLTVNRVLEYQPPEALAFSNAYDDLRSNWFDATESQNLEATIALIRSGVSTGRILISLVTKNLLDAGLLINDNSASGSVLWLNPTKAFKFGIPINKPALYHSTDRPLVEELPASWMPVFKTLGDPPGAISSLIASNIDLQPGYSHPELQSEFREVLITRIEWANMLFDFLEPLGMTEYMYRFAHLKPRSSKARIR